MHFVLILCMSVCVCAILATRRKMHVNINYGSAMGNNPCAILVTQETTQRIIEKRSI